MAIQELPIQVANQIAAGEVVERPASVVKELVENAIDAEASEISIIIKEAGLRSIQVIDNGKGIPADQVNLAFKRHATSKIFTSNDLFRIRSLGFRGEALPSIASVSEVTMNTSDGDSSTEIYLKDGEIVDQKASALRRGTSVLVENLFYNTPARLKYLKALSTELSHITDIINREALGHPDIQFRYVHDGKTLLTTNGKGRVNEVLAAIYGFRQAKDMVAIENDNLDFRVSGYVSMPTLTRASKSYLSLFVNGRYIKNYKLNQAIIKGYGSKLMVGRYPIAVIYIELDPQLIDVNVHPTKQEVRISKEDLLYDMIRDAIMAALQPVQRIPDVFEDENRGDDETYIYPDERDADDYSEKNTYPTFDTASDYIGEQASLDFTSPANGQGTPDATTTFDQEEDDTEGHIHPVPSYLQDLVQVAELDETDVANTGHEAIEAVPYLDTEAEVAAPANHDKPVWQTVNNVITADKEMQDRNLSFPELTYIGQMQGTYLIAENETGMYLIDQHAAQERIKYEYYRDIIVEFGTAMQTLLLPIVFDFSLAQAQQIQGVLPKLLEMGVDLEPFGPTSFQLQQHPLWMGKKNIQKIVEDLIDLVLEDPKATVADYREATAIMMSCKRSIKANHYLNELQAKQLLHDLAYTKNPYNCPHGRPVLVHFSNYEIERMFKRIQDPHQSPQI
ncbi:DNA mismatch repair endonuclease MutL [Aerococcus agrisoli]|uniref:DNA mismatch repair protein MutL n=1 Tax=Aerococcus agrisoli TaxID=2487350 RepID=A0A3N4GRM7_9LACT|nr:DNA mismatch repair endonuclease MutL [Aerococcus agrisoli]RPA61290.1 DNA mismatch repair endonuclease MutL [Aerococcus agrisoli]